MISITLELRIDQITSGLLKKTEWMPREGHNTSQQEQQFRWNDKNGKFAGIRMG